MFQNVFSFSFVRLRSKGIHIGHFSSFVSSQRITKHLLLLLLPFPSMFKFLSLQRKNEIACPDIGYKVNDTVSKLMKIDDQDVHKEKNYSNVLDLISPCRRKLKSRKS